jgi:uncharacterized membrane protein
MNRAVSHRKSPVPSPVAPPSTRFDSVDALRGIAMLWMTVFHFCFDLNHFGFWKQNFYTDPFWTWQRSCILSLFLLTAGLGQAIAVQQGQSWPRFWRRWIFVAGAALLVSIGSYAMYPQTFIYFGVLHGMAAMLIVVRLMAGWGRAMWMLWVMGALVFAIYFIAVRACPDCLLATFSSNLDAKTWNWLGLVTRKPITEDYVPLIPWLGVMCWGMAAGQWVLKNHANWLVLPSASTHRAVGFLATLGRWSLSYYLVHQPVMIGVLTAVAMFAH